MARNIEEKIKAADLSGAKEAEKPSPEEEELQEEAAQMLNNSGEEGSADRSTAVRVRRRAPEGGS